MTLKLQENGYQDWKDETTEEFVACQRKAFLAGFETAVDESEEFHLLREWLHEEREEAGHKYDETGDIEWLGRKMALNDVLTKLSAMGVRGDSDGE